jgi:hypothetical protein
MKKLALVSILLLAVACSSTSMTSSSPTAAGAIGDAAKFAKAPTHYVLLSDPKSPRELDWDAEHRASFYVKGYMTNAGFMPVGSVEGRGRLCADGKEWVDLKNLEVHAAGDAPKAPYVMGCRTSMGAFVPSTRDVVLQ